MSAVGKQDDPVAHRCPQIVLHGKIPGQRYWKAHHALEDVAAQVHQA